MEDQSTDRWRKKVAEEHRLLHQSMAGLRSTLRRLEPATDELGPPAWAADLSRQLVEFHDLLGRHFRFEEKGGMMEDLMESEPRSTGQVHELIEEHAAVLDENRSLIALLLSDFEDAPAVCEDVRRRLSSMLDLLSEHERKENALVMDLALDDLGSGD